MDKEKKSPLPEKKPTVGSPPPPPPRDPEYIRGTAEPEIIRTARLVKLMASASGLSETEVRQRWFPRGIFQSTIGCGFGEAVLQRKRDLS